MFMIFWHKYIVRIIVFFYHVNRDFQKKKKKKKKKTCGPSENDAPARKHGDDIFMNKGTWNKFSI